MNRRKFLVGAIAAAVAPSLPAPRPILYSSFYAVNGHAFPMFPERWANVTMTASEVAERWDCIRAEFEPYAEKILEPVVRQAVAILEKHR